MSNKAPFFDYFSHQYEVTLREVLKHTPEKNFRTKTQVKVIPHPVHIQLSLHNGRLPVAGNRAYYPGVAAAEAAWQTLGTTDPTFIMDHAPKLWGKFIDKDGTLPTAYGARWATAFGRNQVDLAIDALKADPSNRQIWVQAWDPRSDGLGGPNQPLNIPCPIGFSLTITEGRLNMAVFIRSSDLFVGLPYDVMAYALTLDMIAAELGRCPGFLTFTLAHAHLYETHWLAAQLSTDNLSSYGPKPSYGEAKSYCERLGLPTFEPIKTLEEMRVWVQPSDVEPHLPAWPWYEVQGSPKAYVDHVKRLAARTGKHAWNYRPEVVI